MSEVVRTFAERIDFILWEFELRSVAHCAMCDFEVRLRIRGEVP